MTPVFLSYRLLDVDLSMTPGEGGDLDLPDDKVNTEDAVTKSLNSTNGSVHEAIEATDDSLLPTYSSMDQRVSFCIYLL